jgi:RNA polymerase sigma-B factor
MLMDYLASRDRHGPNHARTRSLESRAVDENYRLIRFCAAPFCQGWTTEEIEDLHQAGAIGLLKALRRFEADKGFEFSTFAVEKIRGEMRHFIRDKRTRGSLKVTRTWYDLWAMASARARSIHGDVNLVALCLYRCDRGPAFDESLYRVASASPDPTQSAISQRGQNYYFTPATWMDLVLAINCTAIELDETLVSQKAEDDRAWLVDAIARLDLRSAQVLRLAILEEESIEHTARLLKMSLAEAQRRLNLALTVAKERIGALEIA